MCVVSCRLWPYYLPAVKYKRQAKDASAFMNATSTFWPRSPITLTADDDISTKNLHNIDWHDKS